MPMRPTSGAATSRTREANWSRSLYTSSTVRVPEMQQGTGRVGRDSRETREHSFQVGSGKLRGRVKSCVGIALEIFDGKFVQIPRGEERSSPHSTDLCLNVKVFEVQLIFLQLHLRNSVSGRCAFLFLQMSAQRSFTQDK